MLTLTQKRTLITQNAAQLEARRYRADGYTIYWSVAKAKVPFALGQFRPSFVARKRGKNVLFRVSVVGAHLNLREVRKLGTQLLKFPAWRSLWKVAAGPSPAYGVDYRSKLIPWDGVQQQLSRAKALQEMGDIETAYLLGYAAMQGCLRRRAAQVYDLLELEPTWNLIQQLYNHKELTQQQANRAIEALNWHGDLAGGFDSVPTTVEANHLTELATELLTAWGPTQRCG